MLKGGDKDFTSWSHNVTFPANVTTLLLSISIMDDYFFEANENFTVGLNLTSPFSYVTVSDPDQATVTIIDDDRK